MQFVAIKAVFLFTGLTILLVLSVASWEHCTLPTEQDLKEIIDARFGHLVAEGTAPATVYGIVEVHFTCLAKVAKDMYAVATVNALMANSVDAHSEALEFLLRCEGSAWQASVLVFTGLSLPFTNTETQFQCYDCQVNPPYCLCECQIAWG